MDRPILFSGPMVRAILEGRKTQTRRIAVQPIMLGIAAPMAPTLETRLSEDGTWRVYDDRSAPVSEPFRVRFAKGDRLWVKETHRVASWTEDGEVWISYDADGARSRALEPTDEDFVERLCAKLDKAGVPTKDNGFYGDDIPAALLRRVSIHMPRWASRLTLTVTDVRVERLQAISEADCLAEGAPVDRYVVRGLGDPLDGIMVAESGPHLKMTPRNWYRGLWDTINGAGAWDLNPWVVAVTFKPEQRNIDHA